MEMHLFQFQLKTTIVRNKKLILYKHSTILFMVLNTDGLWSKSYAMSIFTNETIVPG